MPPHSTTNLSKFVPKGSVYLSDGSDGEIMGDWIAVNLDGSKQTNLHTAATGGLTIDTATSVTSANAVENQVLTTLLLEAGWVEGQVTGATFPAAPATNQLFQLRGHATLTSGFFQEDGGGGWQRLSQIA